MRFPLFVTGEMLPIINRISDDRHRLLRECPLERLHQVICRSARSHPFCLNAFGVFSQPRVRKTMEPRHLGPFF